MIFYRYRTIALVGPWRPTPEAALADAVGAKQALIEEDDRLRWLVDGRIEEDDRRPFGAWRPLQA